MGLDHQFNSRLGDCYVAHQQAPLGLTRPRDKPLARRRAVHPFPLAFGLPQAHSMRVLTQVVGRYSPHQAVWGISPVNEVGAWTPMDVLRKFYWEAYGIVRGGAPHWM